MKIFFPVWIGLNSYQNSKCFIITQLFYFKIFVMINVIDKHEKAAIKIMAQILDKKYKE